MRKHPEAQGPDHGRAERLREDRCPLCGTRVHYRGATSVECLGAARDAIPAQTWAVPPKPAVPAKPACPNYKPETAREHSTEVAPPVIPYGSLAWARKRHGMGVKLVYTTPGGSRVPADPTDPSWDQLANYATWDYL